MNPRTALIALALAGFGTLTAVALVEVGYTGIIEAGLTGVGALQILVDLVIACTLAIVWMIADARRRGLNAWPFVLMTLFLGSFGPLLYLLRREWSDKPLRAQAA